MNIGAATMGISKFCNIGGNDINYPLRNFVMQLNAYEQKSRKKLLIK
jgi:hypothetical protein